VVQSACVAPVVALTAANIGTTTPAPSGARFGAAGLAQRVIKPPDRWDDGTGRRDLRLVWSSTERWQTIPSMTTELLSAAEAARILGVPRSRVVDLADTDPAFPAFQPSSVGGRAWPRAAVEAWAAAHPDRGPLHRGPNLPEVGGRSPLVWTVANLAGADAQALHHDWIGPEHLLAALAHPDCPGAARSVLASLGVTAERLQRARQRSFVDPFEPGSGWKQASPAFQLVLERAHLEAVLLADAEVTSEHVLLALASHWAGNAASTGLRHRRGLDPAEVRRRVLDLTEGMAVPPPEAPEPELDPETAMGQVAPGLELAPTPGGKDPRRRMPWGSRIFLDADGTPIKRADGYALRQYYIDRDGYPVLTSDGQPVHAVFDEHGQEVLDEDGRPLIVPVEIPDGSSVEAPAPHT
jgi:prophage regulatory protein